MVHITYDSYLYVIVLFVFIFVWTKYGYLIEKSWSYGKKGETFDLSIHLELIMAT